VIRVMLAMERERSVLRLVVDNRREGVALAQTIVPITPGSLSFLKSNGVWLEGSPAR
jgi:hypothetical protein